MGYGYLGMLRKSPEISLVSWIAKQVAGKEIESSFYFDNIDWEEVKKSITFHELAPFVYQMLKDYSSSIPQEFMDFLNNTYYCAIIKNTTFWQEFLRILTAFEKEKIIVLPLKGLILLKDLYPHQPVRPMLDIDLLFKEEDLGKVETLMDWLGYRKELEGLKEEYYRKNQCHFIFYLKDGRRTPFVEVHWSLDYKRNNRNTLGEIWDRIREVNVEGRRIKVLSPEDTLFSLALHKRRFGNILSLKNVCDVGILLNKYADSLSWDYVLKQCKRYHIRSTLFFTLYQVKLLLEIDIPRYVEKELNQPRWKKRLIKQFIEKNTFLPKRNIKNIYLQAHFLLYDNLWEPIDYILCIPQEQFAMFYNLKPYDRKTSFFYHNRLLYITFKKVFDLFKIPRVDGKDK